MGTDGESLAKVESFHIKVAAKNVSYHVKLRKGNPLP